MFYKYSYYNIVLKENDEFVYLYNSYSGALCKLEKTVHDYILNTVLDDKNKCNFFDKLLSQGFIKPLDLDEYNRIILNERVAVLSYPKRTLSYVIAPTLACNLNCDYCFESGYRNSKIISDEKIIEIANYIISRLSDNIDEIHIGWFGGEPLVAYEQIIKFSEYLIVWLTVCTKELSMKSFGQKRTRKDRKRELNPNPNTAKNALICLLEL